MSTGLAQRRYTEAEIEAMETPDLLALYKQTGDEELKWPLVLRYEGLIKSAALQIRGVYSSFCCPPSTSSIWRRASSSRPMWPSASGAW